MNMFEYIQKNFPDLNVLINNGAVPGSLMPDAYADFVTAELAKDNLDIFYGQAGEMVKTMPRPVSETARL